MATRKKKSRTLTRGPATLRFGKAPARPDGRVTRLAPFIDRTKAPPSSWDFDTNYGVKIPTPVFANDQFGDCVIAGRAHQELRFKYLTENRVIAITDADVTSEYFSESGGADSGLDVPTSLREWQYAGWIAAGKNRRIHGFATLNWHSQGDVEASMVSDLGVGIGLQLPGDALDKFYKNQVWDVSGRGIYGHYVYVVGYDAAGLTCVTWGARQRMTWAFLDIYCDEAFAIVDDPATLTKGKSLIDGKGLSAALTT